MRTEMQVERGLKKKNRKERKKKSTTEIGKRTEYGLNVD